MDDRIQTLAEQIYDEFSSRWDMDFEGMSGVEFEDFDESIKFVIISAVEHGSDQLKSQLTEAKAEIGRLAKVEINLRSFMDEYIDQSEKEQGGANPQLAEVTRQRDIAVGALRNIKLQEHYGMIYSESKNIIIAIATEALAQIEEADNDDT